MVRVGDGENLIPAPNLSPSLETKFIPIPTWILSQIEVKRVEMDCGQAYWKIFGRFLAWVPVLHLGGLRMRLNFIHMVRPSGRREVDDLGPVTDRTGRVEGRTVTTSSRGVRGRHSTFDLPATPTHLAPSFYHDTVYDPYLHAPTIRPRIPYRSATQEPILEFIGQPRQIGAEFFDQMFSAAPQDSSCSTHGYSHAEYGVSPSIPYVSRPADRVCEGDIDLEGDRAVGEEQEKVGSLHIEGEADERGDDDDGDGGDDDQDEGDEAGAEEQPLLVAPVAHASGSDGRPRHGKGKGLTGSFMSVMCRDGPTRGLEPPRQLSFFKKNFRFFTFKPPSFFFNLAPPKRRD
ncbi:hypothetical protein M9H77_02173 [Catharanthus roseus]|uniref:Uncharacterized protein n=1 Tax=Catharanthus roseus TaxID=4058 RepID=A0ACC0C7Q5_CATRO|nr:hypothetical protein M9H77_02173 [Catharanthus roseus]